MANVPSKKDYLVPVGQAVATYEVKKSRFIAYASYADSRDEALAYLSQLKQEFPDARHHCWAYMIGEPISPNLVAMSDDGEPSGTAGKPILNVLQHKNIGDVMLIVVRYFGGIKLGAGGLVRAYSSAAQQVMDELETKTKIFLEEVEVAGPFPIEQKIRHWLSSKEGEVLGVQYSDEVRMTISVREKEVGALKALVAAEKGRLLDDKRES